MLCPLILSISQWWWDRIWEAQRMSWKRTSKFVRSLEASFISCHNFSICSVYTFYIRCILPPRIFPSWQFVHWTLPIRSYRSCFLDPPLRTSSYYYAEASPLVPRSPSARPSPPPPPSCASAVAHSSSWPDSRFGMEHGEEGGGSRGAVLIVSDRVRESKNNSSAKPRSAGRFLKLWWSGLKEVLTLIIFPYKQLSSAIHGNRNWRSDRAPQCRVSIARDLQDSPKMPDALLAFTADVSCARRSLFRDVVSQRKNGGSGGRVLSLLVFPKGEGARRALSLSRVPPSPPSFFRE